MNPLEQRGMAVEEQLRSWSELNVEPFDKDAVDPYTRTRVILMNGIEVESIMFSHQFARHTDNLEIKRSLALTRRVDAPQQKEVNGLNPSAPKSGRASGRTRGGKDVTTGGGAGH